MHEIDNPVNIIDKRAATSPIVLGKECISCGRLLEYKFFPRDSSYRDGCQDQCSFCKAQPRMSTSEHTHRLQEMNYNSEAVKRQRWEDQDSYRNERARLVHFMHTSEFLYRLRKIAPSLYLMDGNFVGDIAVFRTYGTPQPRLEGRTFEYLLYIPDKTWMPEFSTIEFDSRDIPVRERQRGWRTILLRLIKAGVITEEQCKKQYGEPLGEASYQWRKQLFFYRNLRLRGPQA